MSKLQEVFNRLNETKKKQKEIKVIYRDALENSSEYQNLIEKIQEFKQRKKQIEDTIKNDFSSEFRKLDNLKKDIESDKELLSDAALSRLMKGETVEVIDEKENKYEPIFSVRFKKSR